MLAAPTDTPQTPRPAADVLADLVEIKAVLGSALDAVSGSGNAQVMRLCTAAHAFQTLALDLTNVAASLAAPDQFAIVVRRVMLCLALKGCPRLTPSPSPRFT